MTVAQSATPNRSLRVALAGTGIAAIVLILAAGVIDLVVERTLIGEVDSRLQSSLTSFAQLAQQGPRGFAPPRRFGQTDPQVVDVPLTLWDVDGNGDVILTTPHAPDLPAGVRKVTRPTDITLQVSQAGVDSNAQATLQDQSFRIAGVQVNGGWLVLGQSRAVIDQNVLTVVLTELIVIPILLAFIFFLALMVGRRVAQPIEAAHQRQLAFTADASHELRTPLAVIEAETALALNKPREALEYKTALTRVAGEASRLRNLVDSLLWLARFDAAPSRPQAEPVDVSAAATAAAERFALIAEQKGLQIATDAAVPALIAIAPEWSDRLLGVLLDNACRYTPDGGSLRVTVTVTKGHVELAVEDSGPGVPAEQRARIFNRFHRATDTDTEGSGLGLAIADSIVRASGGAWSVGDSSLGGVRFAVTWPSVSSGA